MARNRFQQPDTKRIDISDGDFIVVKKRLNVGEARKLEFGYIRGVRKDAGTNELTYEIDSAAKGIARVSLYVVEWSFAGADGRVVPVTEAAVAALDQGTFAEIEAAIFNHVAAEEQEKNVQTGQTAAS